MFQHPDPNAVKGNTNNGPGPRKFRYYNSLLEVSLQYAAIKLSENFKNSSTLVSPSGITRLCDVGALHALSYGGSYLFMNKLAGKNTF